VSAPDLFRTQLQLEGLRLDPEGRIERWKDMPGESGSPPRVVAVDFGAEQATYFGSGIDHSLEESILALPVQALLAGAPEVLDLLSTQQVVERHDEFWIYTASPDTVLPDCPMVRRLTMGDELRGDSDGGDGDVNRGDVFAVLVDGAVVSEAVSVREDGVSAELWVHTDPSHRRRAYATQAASAWFRGTIGRRLIPFYSHERANLASRKLAEALRLRLVFVLSAYQ
jgi:hypothetical protein